MAAEQIKNEEAIPEASESSPSQALTTTDDISFISTGPRKQPKRAKVLDDDDEPLIDTTTTLPLHSKKTEREKKRQQKKKQKDAAKPASLSLLDLPPELLQEILGHLRPSDLYRLVQVNTHVNTFIHTNSSTIARDITTQRYPILSHCFPLPVPLHAVSREAHTALLNPRRQEMLQIHKKPYQHVRAIDPAEICTCMSCLFAWNNLCLLLDLAHWQRNLDDRDPIPMIPRGTTPEWNTRLLDRHAAIVKTAIQDPLTHAAILEKHLSTTTRTILRTFRGKKTVHPRRLYHLTPAEARQETDEFLARSGPPSYEFPWHRDNYYALEAYVPNRKWSREAGRWVYYARDLHEKDLAWVVERFSGDGEEVVRRATAAVDLTDEKSEKCGR